MLFLNQILNKFRIQVLIEHVYYFPEKEDLVEAINGFVEDKQADMVAIIPHCYNLMERLFHRSVSKEMAFHTHVPLLALPDYHKSVPAFFFNGSFY